MTAPDLTPEQRQALRLPLIDAIGPWEDGEPFDDQELTDEVLMPAVAPIVARMLADARAEGYAGGWDDALARPFQPPSPKMVAAIERSSLGSREAKARRDSVDPAVARRIVRQAEMLSQARAEGDRQGAARVAAAIEAALARAHWMDDGDQGDGAMVVYPDDLRTALAEAQEQEQEPPT